MTTASSLEPRHLDAEGTLIFKDHCYALRESDGTEIWLDMDHSPCHLLDRAVRIAGKLYPDAFIAVTSIGPVN